MANRHRGEITALLDGREYVLCLTLGALAELEDAFGADDMLALAERFSSGRISSRDALGIMAAGLRGGGNEVSDEEVAAMKAEGGAAGYVAIVADLLKATFGNSQDASQEEGNCPKKPPAAKGSRGGGVKAKG